MILWGTARISLAVFYCGNNPFAVKINNKLLALPFMWASCHYCAKPISLHAGLFLNRLCQSLQLNE